MRFIQITYWGILSSLKLFTDKNHEIPKRLHEINP